jgi:hypothetical protein
MCIGGSNDITKMIDRVKEGEGNLKYADYKINTGTYKTELNGLLTQLICTTNE